MSGVCLGSSIYLSRIKKNGIAWNIKLDKPLLTIAIPTYNRASYLDLCLSRIFNQLSKKEPLVEVLISNNNSSDNTEEIVNRYVSQGLTVSYIKNDFKYRGGQESIAVL